MLSTAQTQPKLDQWVDFHDWSYASSGQARQLFEKAVNEKGVDDFQASPAGEEWVAKYNHGAVGALNADKMLAWLRDHNVPGTVKNLIWVFHTLKQEGQLDEAFETVEQQQPAVIVREHTTELAPDEPAETVESLGKIVSDVHASDADRKAAFKKMQVLARAGNARSTVKPTYVW